MTLYLGGQVKVIHCCFKNYKIEVFIKLILNNNNVIYTWVKFNQGNWISYKNNF